LPNKEWGYRDDESLQHSQELKQRRRQQIANFELRSRHRHGKRFD